MRSEQNFFPRIDCGRMALMRPLPEYRHIFFDMDGTVTRSRTRITEEMHSALTKLHRSGRDVIIISGANFEQISSQVTDITGFFLAQNGNHAVKTPEAETLWEERLSGKERNEIMDHIALLPRFPVKDGNDLMHDRGSQIAFSFIGHHEDIEKKEAFDPGGKKRAAILMEHPLISNTVEARIGGTTTLDYFRKGRDKGFNVRRLIELQGWDKDESVYIGDALFPGGNDEAVIGVIDTISVKNPEETLQKISTILLDSVS